MQRTPPHNEMAGPLRSAPSSTPYHAMSDSQQAHIDELVQKNRTLEHMGKKLREELAKSESHALSLVAKHKQQVDTFRHKWAQERVEWMEGCDAVQSAHKIAHLRTAMLLDEERRNVLLERDEMRKERLGRMQRDYKIVLFQIKENELEDRLEELQDELDEFKAAAHHKEQQLLSSHLEIVQKWREKCIGLLSKIKEKEDELQLSYNEKSIVETDTSRLREEVNTLTASIASLNTNLERKSLQLDGAKTENEELERLNAELKRSNADLKRQVDKWQSLDTKEGDEMEKLRKRRIELEVQVKELESRLADSEKKAGAGNQTLEVAKAKMEKYKVRLQEYIEALGEHEKVAEDYEAQITDLETKLERAKEEIKKFKSDEHQRARSGPSKTKKSATPVVDASDEEKESQLETAPPRPRPRPTSKGKKNLEGSKSKKDKEPSVNEEEDSDTREIANSSKPQGKAKAAKDPDVSKPKRGRPPKKAAGSGTEIELTTKVRRGKKKDPEHGSDVEMVQTVKGKGKAKDQDQDSDKEVVLEKPKKRVRPRAGAASESEDVGAPVKKKSTAPAASKQSPTSVRGADDGGDGEPRAKKKRKIRIFSSTQPSAFAWNLDATNALGSLEIPTELSPVKEGELVPPRSIFSKSGSALR